MCGDEVSVCASGDCPVGLYGAVHWILWAS